MADKTKPFFQFFDLKHVPKESRVAHVIHMNGDTT
jgi:hypothetical protein